MLTHSTVGSRFTPQETEQTNEFWKALGVIEVTCREREEWVVWGGEGERGVGSVGWGRREEWVVWGGEGERSG